MSAESSKSSKKQGFMSKLFGSKKDDQPTDKRKLRRMQTVDDSILYGKGASKVEGKAKATRSMSTTVSTPTKKKTSRSLSTTDSHLGRSGSDSTSPLETLAEIKPSLEPTETKPNSRKAKSPKSGRNPKHRKRRAPNPELKIDVSKKLEFPTTPEMILEYHKQKPFLNPTEEWLVVELNEYECLVDGLEIIKLIAEHSKFFEVEPDELWEEFFVFVEEIPSYDEIINYDIWQEFRDVKYLC